MHNVVFNNSSLHSSIYTSGSLHDEVFVYYKSDENCQLDYCIAGNIGSI